MLVAEKLMTQTRSRKLNKKKRYKDKKTQMMPQRPKPRVTDRAKTRGGGNKTALGFGIIYLNKSIINITHLEMTGGLVCGLCLFAGYAFQNYGLMQTTPSKSAFITSVSVILVPIILSVFKLKKVDFPEPLSPTTPKVSPLLKLKLTC